MPLDAMKVKSLFFDRALVSNAADRGTIKVLSRFGAFVRRRARSSIRPGPKKEKTARKRGLKRSSNGQWVSSPGQPPVSHVGTLRNMIYFSYEPSSKSVVIGPVPFSGGAGPIALKALEAGGASISRRTGRPIQIKARPYMKPAFDAELPRVPASFKGQIR